MKILAISLFALGLFSAAAQNTALVITPEKSNFIKTSTYGDVIDFLKAIQTQSQNIHLTAMGKSLEGKDIPVAILSNPLVKTPEEAKSSGKPIVYIQGNIHGGEVEGKEAIMMLMRDILMGDKKISARYTNHIASARLQYR